MAIQKLDSDDYRRVRGSDFIHKGLKRMWELLLALSGLGSRGEGEGASLVGVNGSGLGANVETALAALAARSQKASADLGGDPPTQAQMAEAFGDAALGKGGVLADIGNGYEPVSYRCFADDVQWYYVTGTPGE